MPAGCEEQGVEEAAETGPDNALPFTGLDVLPLVGFALLLAGLGVGAQALSVLWGGTARLS
jgi:hypothetical protein